MAEYTPNVNLYKPSRNDDLEVDVTLSENFTKIDGEFKNVTTQLAEIAAYNVKSPPIPLVGAKGDGVTDDSNAINGLINFVSQRGGGRVKAPKGIYLLSTLRGDNNVFIEPKSNVHFYGDGFDTILKVADDMNEQAGEFGFNVIFPADASLSNRVDNASFKDFLIDCNGENNLVTAQYPNRKNAGIGIKYGSDIEVENVRVINNAGHQCFSFGVDIAPHSISNIKINKCSAKNVGKNVPGNVHATDHSVIYVQADIAMVTNNIFENDLLTNEATAYEIHSKNTIVEGNVAINFNVGMNVVATVTDQINTIYKGNVLTNVQWAFRFWKEPGFKMEDVLIESNNIVQANSNYPVFDLDNNVNAEMESVSIKNNEVSCVSPVNTYYGEGVRVGKIKHLFIEGNKFKGLVGRALSLGSIGDNLHLSFERNKIIDCGRTSNTEATYKHAISLGSLKKIKYLSVKNNEVFNPNGNTLQFLSGFCDLEHGEILDNTVLNVNEHITWGENTIDYLNVRHVGKGNPEAKVRASIGSHWINKDTLEVYEKKMYLASDTGWVKSY